MGSYGGAFSYERGTPVASKIQPQPSKRETSFITNTPVMYPPPPMLSSNGVGGLQQKSTEPEKVAGAVRAGGVLVSMQGRGLRNGPPRASRRIISAVFGVHTFEAIPGADRGVRFIGALPHNGPQRNFLNNSKRRVIRRICTAHPAYQLRIVVQPE